MIPPHRLATKEAYPEAAAVGEWHVYVLRCRDGSLYTGVTMDPTRRLREHNGEMKGGARYTRSRRPVQLVWQEVCASRGAALRREAEIRALSRPQKLKLCGGDSVQ